MQHLLKMLPDLIKAAIAPSTRQKYEKAWNSWCKFCVSHSIVALPADPFCIALYFNNLLHSQAKRGAINDAFYGIRWGHHSAGCFSPTDHPFVKLALDGALRLTEYTGSRRKDPMTSHMIKTLVKMYYNEPYNLSKIRFLVICILGFCGFMRISELLELKIKDLSFYEEYMTIFLKESKTDQLREGNIIYISKTFTKNCPVNLTKHYISLAGLKSNDYLIAKLIRVKRGYKMDGSEHLSYSRTREIFLQFTEPVSSGLSLGLHSLRSGGASAAAENNVSDRLISKHGRWSSERARDGYIADSTQNRLKVSRQLGL